MDHKDKKEPDSKEASSRSTRRAGHYEETQEAQDPPGVPYRASSLKHGAAKETTSSNESVAARRRYQSTRKETKSLSAAGTAAVVATTSQHSKDNKTSHGGTSSGRSRYMESKAQSKEIQDETHSMEPTMAQDSMVYPGAVRVAGPGVDTSTDNFVETDMEDSPTNNTNVLMDAEKQHEPALLHAELVTSSHHLMDAPSDIPLAEQAVPIRPWKQRLGIALIILVVVGITVGITVPLTTSNNSSSNSKTPPPVPTVFPSTWPSASPSKSLAPTSLALTTVVIQLDDKPQETGWKLDCGGDNLANFPMGVYQGFANRLVTAQFPVLVGFECLFTILDGGSDGLNLTLGKIAYRMHFGPVFNPDAVGTIMFAKSGNFTNQDSVEFTMTAPMTNSPTRAPSFSPSVSQEPSIVPTVTPSVSLKPSEFPSVTPSASLEPTLFPTSTPTGPFPTFVPTLALPPFQPPTSPPFQPPTTAPPFFAPTPPTTFAPTPTVPISTSFPTAQPTPSPTASSTVRVTPAPTVNPTLAPTLPPTRSPTVAPTPATPTDILVQVQLDRFPAETGFILTCDGQALVDFPPLTFGNPNQLVSRVFSTRVGAPCTFVITDSFEDGICCQTDPPGFYRLYFGNKVAESNLIASGGEFGAVDSVTFTARLPL